MTMDSSRARLIHVAQNPQRSDFRAAGIQRLKFLYPRYAQHEYQP